MSLNPNKSHAKEHVLIRAFQSVTFYAGYCLFGGLGVSSSLICHVLATFFQGQKAQYFGQKLIHWLFAAFVGYIRFFRLVKVQGDDLARLGDSRGVIFVANHPSIVDVVLIIAQMPRMFCVMKPSLMSNFALSGQSRLAGYVDSSSSSGLIKSCRDNLVSGGNLLIFPEGTRSGLMQPAPFKMGFALVAKESRAPVQTLILTMEQNFLGKGWPFFKQPVLPARCLIRLGERFVPGEKEDARVFGKRVELYYQKILQDIPAASSLL